jgi:hypothetical protein
MRFVAIDPGQDGAVVCIHEDNTITKHKMPLIGVGEVDLQDLYEIIKSYADGNTFFGLEDVKPFPGMTATAMGKMLWIKGVKQGILVSLKVPYEMIHPKTWQTNITGPKTGIPQLKKPNGKNDTKGMALLAAKRLFPNENFLGTERSKVPHDGIVDATLIAYYLKQTRK